MLKEILVIDDNPDIRFLVCNILEEQNFKVRTAANYDQAVLEINKKLNKIKIKSIGMIKKHLKPTKENKGGIVSKESFIHQSNVKNIDIKKNERKAVIKK